MRFLHVAHSLSLDGPIGEHRRLQTMQAARPEPRGRRGLLFTGQRGTWQVGPPGAQQGLWQLPWTTLFRTRGDI